MKPRKDSADKGAGSGCMARLVRCSSFFWDWLAISVYRHIILPGSKVAEKLLSGGSRHKRRYHALEIIAQVCANLEVEAQSRLWCKHLTEGSAIKLMPFCGKKYPSISHIKARLSYRGWHETRIDDLKPYAAFPGGSQVILGRDGDGYLVFGDGSPQVVDAKNKTRYTYEATSHCDCQSDGVSVDGNGGEVHLNSSTNV